MNPRTWLLLFMAVTAAVLVTLIVTARDSTFPRTVRSEPSTHAEVASATRSVPGFSVNSVGPDGVPAQASLLEVAGDDFVEADNAPVLAALEEAAITYDPAQLPLIAPHLNSADPKVRAAAVDAVMLLGDSSGAMLLRQAALRLRNATEAAQLRAKADYLELPPANLLTPEEAAAIRGRLRSHADGSTAVP